MLFTFNLFRRALRNRIATVPFYNNIFRLIHTNRQEISDFDSTDDDMDDVQYERKESLIYERFSPEKRAKFAAYRTKLHEIINAASYTDNDKEDDDDNDDDDDEDLEAGDRKAKKRDDDDSDSEDEEMPTLDADDEDDEDYAAELKTLYEKRVVLKANLTALNPAEETLVIKAKLADLNKKIDELRAKSVNAHNQKILYDNRASEDTESYTKRRMAKQDFASLNEEIFRMVETDNRLADDKPTGRDYLGSHKDDVRFRGYSNTAKKIKDDQERFEVTGPSDDDEMPTAMGYNRNTHLAPFDDVDEHKNLRPFRGVGSRSKTGARIDQMTEEDDEKQMQYIHDKYAGIIRPHWDPNQFTEADNLCLYLYNEGQKTPSGLIAEMDIAKPVKDKKKLERIIHRARTIRELLYDQAMPPLAIPNTHFMYHHMEAAWMLLCRQADCSYKERVWAVREISKRIATWPETDDPHDPVWDSSAKLWACKAAEYNYLARRRVKAAILNHAMDSSKDALLQAERATKAPIGDVQMSLAVESADVEVTYKDEDEMELLGVQPKTRKAVTGPSDGVVLAKNGKPKHVISIDISNVNPSKRAWHDSDEDDDKKDSKELLAMKSKQKEMEKKKK